jgi:hypothetical protein
VSGLKAEIVQKKKDPHRCGYCGGGYATDDCKDGTFCQVTRKNRHIVVRDFGNDWNTFLPYLSLLVRAFFARITRKDMPTTLNN